MFNQLVAIMEENREADLDVYTNIGAVHVN